MKAKDSVMERDQIGMHISEIGHEGTVAQRNWACFKEIASTQAEISFKAGAKEVIDYFFYEVGLVALMGCSTMEECRSKLPAWEAKLNDWGFHSDGNGSEGQ